MITARAHLGILSVVLLLMGCDRQPTLSDQQKQWTMYHGRTFADPDGPLEVISDGFRMFRAYRTQTKTVNDQEVPAKNWVEWGWKLTVRNRSDKILNVTVVYELQDADGLEVASGRNWGGKQIGPGEEATIRESHPLRYESIKRISKSGWTISYEEP